MLSWFRSQIGRYLFYVVCFLSVYHKSLVVILEVAAKAAEVARRLSTNVNNFIYKQIWKGVNVVRWAVAAEEVRHDQPGQSREKYFAWLCANEHRLAL